MKAHTYALALASALPVVIGHGHITWPPSTRHNGSLAEAGYCAHSECLWFSQPTSIPGKPTLPQAMRSYNVDVSGGPADWSSTTPWRAPGTAPVFGSGCGVAGGNVIALPNGGDFDGIQGLDGAKLPKKQPHVWQRGSVQEVAFAITANHGGGYQYRLCKSNGLSLVSEECFQRTPLAFVGDTHWVQYGNQTFQYDKMVTLPRFPIPRHATTVGTHPAGSSWARIPVPGCKLCDQSVCGAPLLPNMSETFKPGGIYGPDETFHGGLAWYRQQQCAQGCSGLNLTACPPGWTQFPEPLPGISGYTGLYPPVGRAGFPYSVVDQVKIPADIEPGEYLLSWRWDCEQSHQIWQNCADLRIAVDNAEVEATN